MSSSGARRPVQFISPVVPGFPDSLPSTPAPGTGGFDGYPVRKGPAPQVDLRRSDAPVEFDTLADDG